ncbi:MAG: iron ABC transporter permease [Cyclobacteriaceae bacterium]
MELRFPSHSGWKVLGAFTVLILLLPIIFVVSTSFSIEAESWDQAFPTLLPLYIQNASILLVGICTVTLIIGVSTAWLVTVFEFPFRKHFEWILILPLSIPTFINAIAYVGLTDYAGPVRILLRSLGTDYYMDVMDHEGAILIMGLVLYPYVYVAARSAFMLQSASLIDVSRSLGQSLTKTFFKVSIPLSWPIIFSGLILVIMEVLNDYGVVQYFGIPTFTTGIFRAWLALGDLQTAILLSLIILVFIIILVGLDTLIQRGRKTSSDNEDRVLTRIPFRHKWLAFSICVIPVFFGFIVPVAQMVWWSVLASTVNVWLQSLRFMGNTAILGVISGLVVLLFAIILSYSNRLTSQHWSSKAFSKLSMLGYAIPGAVIGIGIVTLVVWINPNWIYSGIIALVFGYSARFFAVGYGQTDAGFDKIPLQFDDAASSLGENSMKRLISVHLPIMKPVLIGAFIMVFVDIAKELPLTLILRPFNFETLATNAFQYAKDEMAPKSASSSLLVIFVSSVPVYFLNKILK